VTLPILGLTCGGGGAVIVERAIEQLPAVIRAYANPATEMAYVEYDSEQMGPGALQAVIEQAGYRTILPGGDHEAERRQVQGAR
jgi:copper chaperone CopZ